MTDMMQPSVDVEQLSLRDYAEKTKDRKSAKASAKAEEVVYSSEHQDAVDADTTAPLSSALRDYGST